MRQFSAIMNCHIVLSVHCLEVKVRGQTQSLALAEMEWMEIKLGLATDTYYQMHYLPALNS